MKIKIFLKHFEICLWYVNSLRDPEAFLIFLMSWAEICVFEVKKKILEDFKLLDLHKLLPLRKRPRHDFYCRCSCKSFWNNWI